jgi:hypothetical protein
MNVINENSSYIKMEVYYILQNLHIDVRQELVHNIQGNVRYVFPTMIICSAWRWLSYSKHVADGYL